MTDFGLIMFSADKGDISSGGHVRSFFRRLCGMAGRLVYNAGLYKYSLCTKFFLSVRKRSIYSSIKKVELLEDVTSRVIRLPLAAVSLSGFNRKVIADFVLKLCGGIGLRNCFMPQEALGYSEFLGFTAGHTSRELIYKAHLEYMLKDIYQNRGIRPGSLETVIIAGEDSRELITFVKRLEPYFKFITVAALKDEPVESELSGISEETGLMINHTRNVKAAVKSADLVVNLAGVMRLAGYRFKPSSLVINFNNADNIKKYGEYYAINGLEYLLPAETFEGFDGDVLRCYNKKFISEAVMDLLLGCGPDTDMESISRERVLAVFGKCGLRILGYTGRRGIVKAEDLLNVAGRQISGG